MQLGLDRRAVVGEAAELLSSYDAMLLPTTPSVAPTIEEVSASGDEYARWNLRMLRNPGLINMIDGCAVRRPAPSPRHSPHPLLLLTGTPVPQVSLPCHSPGEEAPIGLMVAGVGGSDRRVLAVARAIEESLAARAE